MSDIVPFVFASKTVRTLSVDGELFFVAKDIAKALGYTNTNKAIRDHTEGGTKRTLIDKRGVSQSTIVIPESDMYSLIFGSKLEIAKEFKRWVTKEVLPSLRKTGTYSTEQYKKLQEELIDTKRELCRMEDVFDMRSMYRR